MDGDRSLTHKTDGTLGAIAKARKRGGRAEGPFRNKCGASLVESSKKDGRRACEADQKKEEIAGNANVKEVSEDNSSEL